MRSSSSCANSGSPAISARKFSSPFAKYAFSKSLVQISASTYASVYSFRLRTDSAKTPMLPKSAASGRKPGVSSALYSAGRSFQSHHGKFSRKHTWFPIL
ncbi:MAG: hypothetical protein K6D94_13430 [Clostridiales bacterium]|nr:hypothetical protein [Clostridiales bacterium]